MFWVGAMSSENLERMIRESGAEITVIKSDADAERFWRAPAKAKVVLFYWSDCHWCKVFMPEFVQIAPTAHSPKLMVAVAERQHIRRLMELARISADRDFGFPYTVLIEDGAVTHKFRSRQAPAFAAELLQVKPELRSLRYLDALSRAGGGQPLHGGGAIAHPCPTPAPHPYAGGAAQGPCVGFGRKPVPPPPAMAQPTWVRERTVRHHPSQPPPPTLRSQLPHPHPTPHPIPAPRTGGAPKEGGGSDSFCTIL